MTIKLPAQLATVSPYITLIIPVSSFERHDGITTKVRVIRSSPSYGEMTVSLKKVFRQQASLKVRNVNGSRFHGTTRRAGAKEPDLLARAAIAFQVMVDDSYRPYTIPVDRYCDEETLLAQHLQLEAEERALTDLSKTEDGRRILKEHGIQNAMFRAGLMMTKAPAYRASSKALTSSRGNDSQFWNTFRKNLGVHLDASNITQTRIDNMIGVYYGYLSHLKRGGSTRLPNDDQLVRLAKILNILPSDLHPEFSRLDQRLIEEIGSDRAPRDPRPEPDAIVEAKEPGQVSIPAPAGPMGPETAEDPPEAAEQPVEDPTLTGKAPAETAQAPNELAPSRAGKRSGLFNVNMSMSPCASQVRLNVEADVPYEVGVRIMGLINEAAA